MSKPTILAVDDDPRSRPRSPGTCASATARVPRRPGDVRGRGAGACSPAGAARQPVALIAADQRMPEMTGIELLEQSRGARARGEVPAAHRVRRHRRRDQRRSTTSASTTTCSSRGTRPRSGSTRCSTTCSTTGGGPSRPHLRRARGRAPLVRPQPRGQDLPGPQPRALPLVRRGARRRGPAAAGLAGGDRGRPAAGAGARRRAAAGADHARAGRRARPADDGRAAAVRRVHRRRRAGRAGRRGVRSVRGAEHGHRRARGARRPGRARARRSRTTSASRRA